MHFLAIYTLRTVVLIALYIFFGCSGVLLTSVAAGNVVTLSCCASFIGLLLYGFAMFRKAYTQIPVLIDAVVICRILGRCF